MTVFAARPILLSTILTVPALALLLLPKQEGPSPLPSKQSPSPGPGLPPLPALTTYRAHMMLMTILAILAVDFPIFPRMLAKCETFGASLMDLGVGSFVFSQGVVSALPLIRDPSYLTAPLGSKVVKVAKKCLPIIALGVVRVLLVKGTEYPVGRIGLRMRLLLTFGKEHVTEYGVHWNFFLTLALIPVLQVLLHPVIIHLPISLVGILVAMGTLCGSQHRHLLTNPQDTNWRCRNMASRTTCCTPLARRSYQRTRRDLYRFQVRSLFIS